MKNNKNYKKNDNKTHNATFKENFFSMSEGNTCIAEPKLEVLPFA